MEALSREFSKFLLTSRPLTRELLAIVKGVRNGLVYGVKIRAPHALVMTALFREGSVADKLTAVFDATKAHARALASFVGLFKSAMLALKLATGGYSGAHPFAAGLVGGYLVFGSNTPINQQIVLYLFARVAMALGKVLLARLGADAPPQTFSLFAALVWGCVMWLFYEERATLQSSLTRSMEYLYTNADVFDSLRTLLWHNA